MQAPVKLYCKFLTRLSLFLLVIHFEANQTSGYGFKKDRHRKRSRNTTVLLHSTDSVFRSTTYNNLSLNWIDWDSVTRITCSTDYYQRLTLQSWFTTLEQTPLNLSPSYRHRTNDLLTESNKTNYERTTGQLKIWRTINDCLAVTLDGSKRTNGITSLHSQYHHSLINRRPIT